MRKVIVLLALGLVVLVAACSGSSSGLTGKTWQWTASTEKVPASQSVVPDPANYTIEFKSDGTYAVKADCNSGSGAYTTSGSSLTLQPGPMTLAACPDTSLDSTFLQGLMATSSYAVANGELTLTQTNEGTMTFK
jgi:heat shock protein HslJ